MRFQVLEEVNLGAFYDEVVKSYRPNRIKDSEYFSYRYYGKVAVLQTRRGHLAIQSYDSIVAYAFNTFVLDSPTKSVTIWESSLTTSRHIDRMYETFKPLRKELDDAVKKGVASWWAFVGGTLLPWWDDCRHKSESFPQYVGPIDPFESSSWELYAPIRLNQYKWTLGEVKTFDTVRVETIRETGGITYRVLEPEWQRLQRKNKFIKTFTDESEAITYAKEMGSYLAAVKRLKEAA